jgi:hypothetical protein
MAVGPHDYKEAVKWFRLAAEKGNRDAQHALGTMYENGQGVKPDYVLAYTWFKLAAHRGLADAAAAQSQSEKQMTAAQIAKAEALVRNWKRK